MKNNTYPRDVKGVALIVTVGILALMALIATSFAINMVMNLRAAKNSTDGVKAQMAAEAGIALAIREMRAIAITNFNATPLTDWTYTDSARPSFDAFNGTTSDSISLDLLNGLTCSLRVVDTASQININDTNPRLGVMLENLVTILGPPLVAGDGNAIVAGRPAAGYSTKEQIMFSLPGALALQRQKYNVIREFITTSSYINPYSGGTQTPALANNWTATTQPKAPININTASLQVLDAALRTILFFVQDLRSPMLAQEIIDARPFTNWQQFNTFIDSDPSLGPIGLVPGEKIAIENNVNPNRVKSGSYTTDFCFHPSGYYEITSTGRLGVAAQKEITAIVKIYDILHYTTSQQFRGEDINDNGVLDAGEDTNGNLRRDSPTYQRVTWMNGCPKNAASLFGQYDITSAEYVFGALKIGFWDNFDEDTVYSARELRLVGGDQQIAAAGDPTYAGNELYSLATNWPQFRLDRLTDANRWRLQFFSIRIRCYDIQVGMQMREVPWVQFYIGGMDPSILLAKSGPLEWGGNWFHDCGRGYPCHGEAGCLGGAKPWWIFVPQLRRFPDGGDIRQYWIARNYVSRKTFNMINSAGSANATVYDGVNPSTTVGYPVTAAFSKLTLLGAGGSGRAAWDDIRIIPADGFYTFPCQMPVGTNVKWGAISFTTMTPQANTTVLVWVDAGGGFQLKANNAAIGAAVLPRDAIQYRVNFTSTGNFQNTPILEDVIITYLPTTRILYLR